MATYNKILKAGTQANYNALETKDANVLYFCTDTGKMYKGDVDFTNAVVYASTKPTTPIVDKLYVLADTNTVEVYNGTKWTVVSYPMATSLSSTSDNVHTVSAKAVYDAIEAAKKAVTGGAGVINTVAAASGNGQLTVKKGDGTSTTVTVPGVVTKPTWNSTTRVLTLPVTGGTAVTVNIGKDIFIDPNAANGYNAETQTIDLYLNDGSGSGTGTKISVPAAGLVDVYTGSTSNGVTTTIGDDKVVNVSLVLDPDAKNKLKLTSAGLMLDLSAYSTTTQMNTAIKVAKDAADAAQATANTNKTAIATLNGNASTAGSVANKIAAESTTLKNGVIKTAQSTADAAKTAAANNAAEISKIADAIAWGTF